MHQIYAHTVYNITVTSNRHVSAGQFHHQEVHSKLKTIHSETNHRYVVCLKSKCPDFPMYESIAYHVVDVYWPVGSDLGYMFILVSTGLVASVVRYCCLCVVVF